MPAPGTGVADGSAGDGEALFCGEGADRVEVGGLGCGGGLRGRLCFELQDGCAGRQRLGTTHSASRRPRSRRKVGSLASEELAPMRRLVDARFAASSRARLAPPSGDTMRVRVAVLRPGAAAKGSPRWRSPRMRRGGTVHVAHGVAAAARYRACRMRAQSSANGNVGDGDGEGDALRRAGLAAVDSAVGDDPFGGRGCRCRSPNCR